MLEMMFLESHGLRRDIECLGQERSHIAHRFFTLAKLDEIQNFGRIDESILNFFRQVGVAVLTDSNVVDIADLRADRIQTGLYSQGRETCKMLDTIQTLFSDGENDLAVLNDRRGCIGVKHVEAKNQHGRQKIFGSVMRRKMSLLHKGGRVHGDGLSGST